MNLSARSLLCLPVLLAAAGCNPGIETVLLTGVVNDAPYDEGLPLADVEIATLDGNLEPFSEATTDASGAFSVEIAAAQDLFLELNGAGLAPTIFAGEAGIFDLQVEEGSLYALPEDYPAAVAEAFGDCAGDGTGGVVEGEVRVYMPGEEDDDVSLVGTAWVIAYNDAGEGFEACYLDEDGEPAPDDQEQTNATGRFAVFGLEPGAHILEVAYGDRPASGQDPSSTEAWYWYYKVNMVADGLAPFYPAWVEFTD